MSERRLPTPLVLATASAMCAVGVAAWIIAGTPDALEEDARAFEEVAEIEIDDRTPDRVAEGFYDLWRRRRWDQALEISVGPARDAVQQKRARDESLSIEERAVAERAWAVLARAPLTLLFDESENLGEGRVALRGTAEYQFVGRPYRRRVEVIVIREGARYRVERMTPGEVLTPLPSVFSSDAFEPEEAAALGETPEAP